MSVIARCSLLLSLCFTTAGADIKEIRDKNFAEVYKSNFLGSWAKVTTLRKPIVGAVSGYAVSPLPPLRLASNIT